jgi:hypothetical protein
LRIIDDGANCEDSRLILGEMEPLRLDDGLLQLIVSLEKALNRGPFVIFVKNDAGLIELHYLKALKISIHHPQRHLKCILHSFVLRRIFQQRQRLFALLSEGFLLVIVRHTV